MRCLMTAGPALDRDNIAGYNCSYVAIDHPRAFDEILYILMCGTGVGFSVERQCVNSLPLINEDMYNVETVIQVHDSRIGWATAFRQLLALLYAGQIPRWDLSKLRPKGARLKTFGGRASGPDPLNHLFQFCVDIFKRAAGRKLNSLECHDIVCKIADIVIVGGVRRSALISLSNLSDDRMRNAKNGQWWISSPQRALANNSAAYTEKPEIEIFLKEWLTLIESKSGERGIFNRVSANKKIASTGRRKVDGYQFGTNPCGEIYLRSAGLCNLSEVVVRPEDTLDDLMEKVRLATIIGTFQSTMTEFRYLRGMWKKNAEDERLLGVSMTGIMDHPVLSQVGEEAAEWMRRLRAHSVDVNIEWADRLGIEPSAAVTCVKPSGCQILDNKIRVVGGNKSVREIFESVGWTEEMMVGKEREWLTADLTKLPKVFDRDNQLQSITGLFVNGNEQVYEIEFEDGNIYEFTGNHRLMTSTGWKRVDALDGTEEILTESEYWDKVSPKEIINGNWNVPDIRLDVRLIEPAHGW